MADTQPAFKPTRNLVIPDHFHDAQSMGIIDVTTELTVRHEQSMVDKASRAVAKQGLKKRSANRMHQHRQAQP
jgi:hypothetical protein